MLTQMFTQMLTQMLTQILTQNAAFLDAKLYVKLLFNKNRLLPTVAEISPKK
jgi:hypothetical protein